MEEKVQQLKSLAIKFKYNILTTTSIVLTIIGMILFSVTSTKMITNEAQKDYTDCEKVDIDSRDRMTCYADVKKKNQECLCIVYWNLTNDLVGKVNLYYEVTTINQNENYLNSRDDNQLKGIILPTPSENCDPFQYDVVGDSKVPIAPCGEIADTMFTDNFVLEVTDTSTLVPLLYSGMLSDEDKIGFRNPDNLKLALQNFTKPKSWMKNIWELDEKNEANNGFQNEHFISWMRTDWKRKPFAHVDQTKTIFAKGLSAGQYTLKIVYRPSKYVEQRVLIINASKKAVVRPFYAAGAVLLAIGLLMFAATASLYSWEHKMFRRKEIQVPRNDSANRTVASNESPLL